MSWEEGEEVVILCEWENTAWPYFISYEFVSYEHNCDYIQCVHYPGKGRLFYPGQTEVVLSDTHHYINIVPRELVDQLVNAWNKYYETNFDDYESEQIILDIAEKVRCQQIESWPKDHQQTLQQNIRQLRSLYPPKAHSILSDNGEPRL